jgi:group I intron endonuclease
MADNYGVIYKITNKINNKVYIGQTIRTLAARFNSHCHNKKTAISLAIIKYGKESFTIEELAVANSKEELNNLEKSLIESNNTISPNGYNLAFGGDCGGKPSEETRQKMSLAKKGKLGNNKGKHWKVLNRPKEYKSRNLSPETYAKIAAKNTGKIRTEDVKLKMSLAKKGKPATWNHVPVVATNIKTGEILHFKSTTEAAIKLNCLRTSISNILMKTIGTIKSGWTFKYAEVSIGR